VKYTWPAARRDIPYGTGPHPTDPTARRTFYGLIILVEWAWLPVIGLILWLYPAPLTATGFALPAAGRFGWLFAGAITAAVLIQTAVVIIFRDRFADDPKTIEGMRHIWHMLPRSDSEQRWWMAVSVTAGICEEILYRGFLFFYFQEIWGQPVLVALVASSFLFGLAHIYQGIRHGAVTGVIGLIMGGLYAATGSLLIPSVLHVIIDWRTLVFVPAIKAADEAPEE